MNTIDEILLSARIVRPYYARAIAALTPIPRPGLGTVAVDKWWRLYYDLDWLNTLPIGLAGNVIAMHEIEHLLRNHAARSETIIADHQRWNIAADAEINDDISASDLPAGCVFPCSIGCEDHLLAEDYYDQIKSKSHKHCGGGSGSGGSPIDGEIQTCDGGVHASCADDLIEAVAADVKKYEKKNGIGSVPNNIVMWADSKIKKPAYSWRAKLSAVFSTMKKHKINGRADYSWLKMPRRGDHSTIRPGLSAYKPKVHVVLDTSGSMSEYGPMILGHIYAISKSSEIKIWECDTLFRVVKNSPKFQFTGGGGTDLRGAIIAAEKKCDMLIIITDCDTPWASSPPIKTPILLRVGKGSLPPWDVKLVDIAP